MKLRERLREFKRLRHIGVVGLPGPVPLGNARHVAEAGPEKALTGPVERGDAATVEKHLAAIEDADDRALYRLLTKRLLRIAKAKHSERDFAAIEELVSQDV